MFKDKYPSIFSQQKEAAVFIFHNTRRFENWGISLGYSPILVVGNFSHVTRLDQSRASENIWWIITRNISRVIGIVSVYIRAFNYFISRHSGQHSPCDIRTGQDELNILRLSSILIDVLLYGMVQNWFFIWNVVIGPLQLNYHVTFFS